MHKNTTEKFPVPAHWLDIAKQINSIAQTGLAFTKDKFDNERTNYLDV